MQMRIAAFAAAAAVLAAGTAAHAQPSGARPRETVTATLNGKKVDGRVRPARPQGPHGDRAAGPAPAKPRLARWAWTRPPP